MVLNNDRKRLHSIGAHGVKIEFAIAHITVVTALWIVLLQQEINGVNTKKKEQLFTTEFQKYSIVLKKIK